MCQDRTPVVLVTGATDGLGKGLATALVQQGATVLAHGRSATRLEALSRQLRLLDGVGGFRTYQADFASLADVCRLAEEVSRAESRLDVLINNAGIGATVPGGGVRQESADGYELRFAVNYLSTFLLTRLLLPVLRRSRPARVVNVSSAGQAPIDFDDIMLTDGYDGTQAYGQSKLAQIMFTFDIAETVRGQGVTVNALHPATYMSTKIVAAPTSTVDDGVRTTLRLALDPALEGETGQYFDQIWAARAIPQAYDAASRHRLRQVSQGLVSHLVPAQLPCR